MSISFKAWTGLIGDRRLETEEEKKLKKNGSIWLVSPDSFNGFATVRNNCAKFMARNSHEFVLTGVRLVPHARMESIVAQLNAFKSQWDAERERFMAALPELKRQQCEKWDQQFPARAGFLAEQYPSDGEIAAKFDMSWMTFRIDTARLDEVFADERDRIRQYARSYVDSLAGQFRTKVVEACLAFTRGLNVKSGQVNEKKVQAFKDFLDQIEGEDLLGDTKMREIIGNMRQSVFSVRNWTSEEVAQTKIQEYLEQAVEVGKDAGEAAAVAAEYVRRVSGVEEMVDEVEEEVVPIRRLSAAEEEIQPQEDEAELATT